MSKNCMMCGETLDRSPIAKYCFACADSLAADRNRKVRATYSEHRKEAMRLVQEAKRLGLLPRLHSTKAVTWRCVPKTAKRYKCVDCGRPATVYDHRDYSNPLAVDPVCVSCNKRRGRGKCA